MKGDETVFLGTYPLQMDMRIRLPKLILDNLDISKGKTEFDIFLSKKDKEIILRIHPEEK